MHRLELLFLCLCIGQTAHGANWPQFRGPQASGLATNAPGPVQWDVERNENIRWQAPVPGLGHSSPIIWNKHIYVTTATTGSKTDLKVGLYGDIGSATDTNVQQWHLLAFDKATG